jgi:2-aminobenzoate-CoA ligase
MHRSGHVDTFTRDQLPPPDQWPGFLFTLPGMPYPERLNCASAFIDDHVKAGHGESPCLISDMETWTYAELQARVNRLAHVLTAGLGVLPGNRVLLRGANSPMLVALFFAVLKAGGVAVITMPMLRAKELAYQLDKAQVSLALSEHDLADELLKAAEACTHAVQVHSWGKGGSLDALVAKPYPADFVPADTASDDVALIGFTSGTTGEPKATLHFHRDLLAICDGYCRHVLKPEPTDRFIGSPPLAFTFGLGGLALFPLRIGATAVLIENGAPDKLLAAIVRHRATVCFTAPTAYRAILGKLAGHDLSSLRRCVSAGEALPLATFDAWKAATGLSLMDGIGATEMLHIFIASPEESLRPGSTGKPVPGYEAVILDATGQPVPDGTPGRLAVRGQTGCRYLADTRQRRYVQQGWNITGDTYVRDQDGYFWYQARSDDMIVSAGYNIAGPEVESCLLTHPFVAECGVVGQPDPDRGMIVKAYVVLKAGTEASPELAKILQDYVKAEIAPYKYPRALAFVASLPRTNTGKLQRFELRRMAASDALENT